MLSPRPSSKDNKDAPVAYRFQRFPDEHNPTISREEKAKQKKIENEHAKHMLKLMAQKTGFDVELYTEKDSDERLSLMMARERKAYEICRDVKPFGLEELQRRVSETEQGAPITSRASSRSNSTISKISDCHSVDRAQCNDSDEKQQKSNPRSPFYDHLSATEFVPRSNSEEQRFAANENDEYQMYQQRQRSMESHLRGLQDYIENVKKCRASQVYKRLDKPDDRKFVANEKYYPQQFQRSVASSSSPDLQVPQDYIDYIKRRNEARAYTPLDNLKRYNHTADKALYDCKNEKQMSLCPEGSSSCLLQQPKPRLFTPDASSRFLASLDCPEFVPAKNQPQPSDKPASKSLNPRGDMAPSAQGGTIYWHRPSYIRSQSNIPLMNSFKIWDEDYLNAYKAQLANDFAEQIYNSQFN